MKKIIPLLLALALPAHAATVNYVWNNSGTDMLEPSCYTVVSTGEVSASLPDSDDLVWFHGLPAKQPHLSGNLTLWGIRFADTNNADKSKFYASTDDGLDGYNHSGWVITGAEGAVLTLTRKANLGQSENNQCLIASCSYGTNRIECAVQLSTSAKIMGNAGRLVLAGPISQAANGTTLLMDSGGSGGIVLAAANPDFLGILDTSNCNVELAHPDALCGIARVVLTSSNGGGNPRYFRNATGEELVCDHPFQFWMNKCEATIFDGPPMRFPAATLCPDSGLNHAIWVGTSLTIGAVSNKNATAGSTAGRYAALDYYGDGSLHVLGDFGPSSIPGVTNVLRLLGGTAVLHDPRTVAATPVAFGQKGTNTRRPRLGILQDLSVKEGLVPGGEIFFRENCEYGGWAAFGGDRSVTLEAERDGILRLYGWKGVLADISAGLSFGGSTDWYLAPGWFLFGSDEADGTVTLTNDIDVNRGDSNAHFSLGAFQGGAFVAGRLSGLVTNSVAGFLNRQLRKDTGDGVVAVDGPVYLTGAHYVSSGGLLLNGPTAGSATAKSGAWLGGTGTIRGLVVEAGGTVRPGERGGTLTVDGAVTMKDGATLVVDVGAESNGCIELRGTRLADVAENVVPVVPVLGEDVAGVRKVRILDWSAVSNPTSSSLLSLDRFSVDADPEVFSKAVLSVEGDALYLTVSPAGGVPTAIFLLQ